jgi:hypothetical protein
MAPRRNLDLDDLARWEQLREEAAARRSALMNDAPGDPLDRLAWKAGAGPGEHAFDDELRELIEAARAARYTWREIAAALGEGDDQASATRVQSKQYWRNETHERQQSPKSRNGDR